MNEHSIYPIRVGMNFFYGVITDVGGPVVKIAVNGKVDWRWKGSSGYMSCRLEWSLIEISNSHHSSSGLSKILVNGPISMW